jgi:hypothetical protein
MLTEKVIGRELRMARLITLLTAVSLLCCTETRKSKDLIEVLDKVEESNSTVGKHHKVSKLERLKVWADSTRILELPFKANFDTTTEGTFRVKFWETDSIFSNDFSKVGGDVYLMGLLSDTTNFYGFAFVSIAAVGNPGLVTFDKSGNRVDLKKLTNEKCVIYAGDILLCKEYTTIGKDLSLDYYYKSVVYDAGDSMDTVCSHSISKGQISRKGRN